MKRKKDILLLILSIVILGFSSCYDLLEEDTRSQTSDTYLSTAQGLEDGLNAVYSYARRVIVSWAEPANFYVHGTDLWTHGFGGDLSMAQYNPSLNSNLWILDRAWRETYIAINTANAVINRAPEVTGMSEDVKNIRVAEARFLRAWNYFFLVQQWGPVHLSLEETQGAEREAVRAPRADIYEAIINDLNFAAQILPVVASDYGRATKPASEHLLAKVYLTRAGYPDAAQPDDYSNAARLARGVIDNYNFRLLDDFADVFAFGEGERHDEVIWAIQNSKNMLTNQQGNWQHAMFLSRYEMIPGMVRDMSVGRPWSRYKPTDFHLEELYDRQHDDRYEKTFVRVIYTTRPGTYTSVNGYPITLELGDTAAYFADREWSDEELEAAGYNVYTPSLQTDRLYPILVKYLDFERIDVNDMRGSRDFYVARLAETYLIAAEALMMEGNPGEAATYVNAVRTRAAIKGATEAETEANRLAMQITPDQLDIDFILDERGRELSAEYNRWTDLVRTGKLVERVLKYNVRAAPNIQDYHILRPIPQNQIDRTTSVYEQNPGY